MRIVLALPCGADHELGTLLPGDFPAPVRAAAQHTGAAAAWGA